MGLRAASECGQRLRMVIMIVLINQRHSWVIRGAAVRVRLFGRRAISPSIAMR